MNDSKFVTLFGSPTNPVSKPDELGRRARRVS